MQSVEGRLASYLVNKDMSVVVGHILVPILLFWSVLTNLISTNIDLIWCTYMHVLHACINMCSCACMYSCVHMWVYVLACMWSVYSCACMCAGMHVVSVFMFVHDVLACMYLV